MVRLRISAVLMVALLAAPQAGAETKEQWIELGGRIHGGFGALIPIGIRIGLDAKERLQPELRGLSVAFYRGERAPCPCIADGIMIATGASPGQGTLQIAAEAAPAGLYAMVVIRNRKTGAALRYTIADTWGPRIIEWNRSLDPAGRFDAAMSADGLFQVEPVGAN
jgi:FmdE protein associated with molybdenum formylmethanofuran dehydrogenase